MSLPFHFCYHCGSDQLEQRSWREVKCSACSYSQYLFVTSAAVGLVQDAQGRLLLMRRAHEPAMGKLGLPGGIIEAWQTAEAACSREVLEETGITVPEDAWSYLGTFNNRYQFQGYVWPTLDIVFMAKIESFEAACAVDGEASEVIALPLSEIVVEELAFQTHIDAVKRLMARV
jgi:ADP-ribose pyrophosphatase